MKNFIIFTLIFFTVSLTPLVSQDITFFNYWTYFSDIENSLYKHHCHTLFELLAKRKNEIDKLSTKEDWIDRQNIIRKELSASIQLFTDKQPLNARVSEVLIKDGYRIEKIIYESLPDYYITGAMYIPEGIKKNAPAIFYACGHSVEGFRVAIYQHIIINLVKKGFVVFTIDPMGQGERYEYWDNQENKPVFPIPDHQHSYAGAQCLLSGYSVASYFIWDVIRGIDYMLTRPEVDPERIGMTGGSGGGNITAYLGAMDERILASAPERYITNYEYLCKTIGPQCAEQNLYQMVLQGLDHPDFIVARAPKPTLIISTTRDFFSIQGARESYMEAKKMYDIFDADEMLSMVEDDAMHTSTKKNREAMYAFFQKFLDNPGSSEDLEVKVPGIQELQITKSGQIQTALNAETVFSLNKIIAQKRIGKLEESRSDYKKHLKEMPSLVSKISGFKDPENNVKPIFSGRFVNPEYNIEKYLITVSDNYVLPILLFKSTGVKLNEMIILLDTQGIKNAMTGDSLIYSILNEGYSVLLADLSGIGEMGPGYLKGDSYIDGTSFNQWFTAVLTGSSHVGLRSQDIVNIIRYIRNNFKEFTKISAIAKGPVGSDLLHATLFTPEISRVCFIRPFLSYQDIATTRYYKPEYIPFTVAGTIGNYDLPDLMAAISPRKILIIDPERADGMPASATEIKDALAFPIHVYTIEGHSPNFTYQTHLRTGDIQRYLLKWLKE